SSSCTSPRLPRWPTGRGSPSRRARRGRAPPGRECHERAGRLDRCSACNELLFRGRLVARRDVEGPSGPAPRVWGGSLNPLTELAEPGAAERRTLAVGELDGVGSTAVRVGWT